MIQVINRALNMLEYLARNQEREIGLTEIADYHELNHGTCANILKTLVDRGYVLQMGQKKGYKLGQMVARLSNNNFLQEELIEVARRYMANLKDDINESVILSSIEENKRTLLHEEPSEHEIQVRTINNMSAYKASTSRIILAYYTPQELDSYVHKYGLPTFEQWIEVESFAGLTYKLNSIREKGLDISINANKVVGISAPIFRDKKVVAGIGIYLPEMRYGTIEQEKYPQAVRLIAQDINLDLAKKG